MLWELVALGDSVFAFRLRLLASSVILAVAVLGLAQLLPGDTRPASLGQARGVFTPHEFEGVRYFLYAPSSLSTATPNTVFVAAHGMGAEADGFASGLRADAERNGWLMVVPQLPYGDWTQPEALKVEEKRQMAWLVSLLSALPEETGLPVRKKALLYGFSRGAQLSHRFALAYPHMVLAAAIMAPGTYTLPLKDSDAYGSQAPLDFPVGVNDIDKYCGKTFDAGAVKEVPFWVGVGERDDSPGDVPRMWDRYLGKTRVERAQSFAASLKTLDADVELTVFPGLGHEETVESRALAMAFLREHELERTVPAAPGDDLPLTPERLTLALVR